MSLGIKCQVPPESGVAELALEIDRPELYQEYLNSSLTEFPKSMPENVSVSAAALFWNIEYRITFILEISSVIFCFRNVNCCLK